MKTKCPHKQFDCNVNIARIEDIGRFMAEVRVTCQQCGTPFRFIGLPAGMDYNSPCVSMDACELRAPVAPKGKVVSELKGGPQGFTIRRSESESSELFKLCKLLDIEMDGVKCPASAAAILNAIRRIVTQES